MNSWKITLSNLRDNPLYTFLSIFSLAVSIALLMGILQLDASVQKQFKNNLGGVDLVVGAKGSPLQLVLSSVLHIDNPTGNISYKEARKIAQNPLIKDAVPISYGDNYKGFRIVGTTKKFNTFFHAELSEGRLAEHSLEVVIGNEIATKLKLHIGDKFLSSHGLAENSTDQHDSEFTVVGIYKPSYTVVDRLICTPLESIWAVHDHENNHKDESSLITEKNHHQDNEIAHHHHETELEQKDEQKQEFEEKEITAMLISFRNPVGLITIPRIINEQTNMQAALPKFEIDRLFKLTGIGIEAISWIAYIILLISCLIIFVSLYKMVKDRAFDLALMRTYGASNFLIARIIALEGFVIVFISMILGFAISQIGLRLILQMLNSDLHQEFNLSIPVMSVIYTALIIVSVVFLGILIAILPLFKMNISKILKNEK